MSKYYIDVENAQSILLNKHTNPAMREAVQKWCENDVGIFQHSIEAYLAAQKLSGFKMMLYDDGNEAPHLVIPLYSGELRVWLHSLIHASIEEAEDLKHVMNS